MKNMSKHSDKFDLCFFIRFAAFFVVFIFILSVLSYGPFSHKEATQFNNFYKDANSFIIEPENTIDIVCIGTSEPYTGYVPHKVYDEYGYTSVNTCMTFQDTVRSYTLLKELLNYQNPKVLIIETDMLDYQDDKSKILERYESLQKLTMPISEKRFNDIVSSNFPIFNYNDRWKSMTATDLFNSFDKNIKYQSNNHGYLYNSFIDSGIKENKINITNQVSSISYECEYYLDKMIELCNENNIKYFLVELPQNSWTYAKHNAVEILADKYNCDFIDYNLMTEKIDLNIKTDFRDSGHLNYNGAVKVSLNLAEYLNDNYSDILCDHRGDKNYEFYEKSVENFYAENKIK